MGPGARMGRHAGGLLRCLRQANLSDSQKADIKAIFDAAKPTFEADVQAIKAAHQKLNADFDAGADKSVLGADYVAVRAAGQKLKDDGQAVQTQILGKLDQSQQSTVQSCLDAQGKGGHMFHSSSEE